MKRSPLEEWHRKKGARFGPGGAVPEDFGDAAAEYRAVRTAVGLLDRSSHALLRLTGGDRAAFLNGMVSNDVGSLAAGEGVVAAFLDIHGRILSDAAVLAAEEELLVILPAERCAAIADHLQRHIVADDVTVEERSDAWALLSLQGPAAPALLQAAFPGQPLPAQPLAHARLVADAVDCRALQVSHTGEAGFDLVAPRALAEALAARLEAAGAPHGARWVGLGALETLRIEAGIPRCGADFGAENLLLEVNLDHAVSFRKGCYLGQEIVERVRSRGHVNRKLVCLRVEGADVPSPGTPLRAAEKEVGRITSSCFSPLLGGPLSLGYVHRDFLRPDARLSVGGAGAPAAIVDPPARGRAPMQARLA